MNAAASPDRPANRLLQESSPYLQQHAYNPVDWFPWGEEAFAEARRQDKPIFLSVGYSACHWCHVMERESFENNAIAQLLNENFISIKVDREERPDIDQIYMSAVQLITRRGGWPMSVFLTPDARPFYGGTYWPPNSRMGMPGFRDILLKLHDYWSSRRGEVESSADQLLEAIQGMAAPIFEHAELNEDALRAGVRALVSAADREQGGFGLPPKFPHPMDLRVLLRGSRRFGDQQALEIARLTLTLMARGGIYDQLGGGFHRYSTDGMWLVPHFEKMLYDNALLVPAYLEMLQLTGEDFYRDVARDTLDYVLREMTDPAGGFYSTQDADSEGEEGKFFVWTPAETTAVLGSEQADIFNDCYDVTSQGNWEGNSILHLPRPLSELALRHGRDPESLKLLLQSCRSQLLQARAGRIPPGRDEKVLSGWNGMMISAFAQGAAILNEPRYLVAARNAARFVLESMRDDRGRLLHSWKDGRARFAAYLDDYACVIDGLVDLFQADGDVSFLHVALDLCESPLQHFADSAAGGFFYTADDHEQLIARTKDSQDNATPSGNSMMATALARLGRLTGRSDLEDAARRTLDFLAGLLLDHPRAGGQAWLALEFLLGPTFEIVVTDAGDGLAEQYCAEIWKQFLPNKVIARWPAATPIPAVLPLLEGKLSTDRSRMFICERGVCQSPAETPAEAAARLATLIG